jgi:hypothetical protein
VVVGTTQGATDAPAASAAALTTAPRP